VEGQQPLKTSRFQVLVAETKFSDGNWEDALEALANRRPKVALVLTDVVTDARLWTEAIHRGAYDLIAAPLDNAEIRRIVRNAQTHAVLY